MSLSREQQCSNAISLFFHRLDHTSDGGNALSSLFEEDGIVFIQMGEKTSLFMGRPAIASWAKSLQEKYKGLTRFESNIILTKNDKDSYKNESYWECRNGGEVLSYGTHKDILLAPADSPPDSSHALFSFRSVRVTWTKSEGHLPPCESKEDVAAILYQSKASWNNTWSDIEKTGNLRWKKGEDKSAEVQYGTLEKHNIVENPIRIFAPLCGDATFLVHCFNQGHRIVGVDCSMNALQSLFRSVEDFESKEENEVFTMQTSSGLAKVPSLQARNSNQGEILGICADIFFTFQKVEKFDVIFDKDALGALPYDLHKKYVYLMTSRLKNNGHYYLEVKCKEDGDTSKGPPFHISEDYVRSLFPKFEILEITCNPFGPVFKERGADHISYLLQKKED